MNTNKKPLVIFLIFLLSSTFLVTFAPTAQAAEIWVDINLPYTITQSGNYRIATEWTGSGTSLSINASNVVVDGQNNLIQLTQAEDEYAIVIAKGSSNVLLENINQTSADYGLYAEEGNFTTQDSTFTNNTSSGIFAFNVSDFTIQHSRLSNNSYGLVTVGSSNFMIKECHVKNNTEGIETVYSDNFSVENSYLNENGQALYAISCINFNLTGSAFENNEMAIIAEYSGNFTVDQSFFDNNEVFGLACIGGNFTVTNSAVNNGMFGVYGVECDLFTISNTTLTNNLGAILSARCNLTVRDSEMSYNMYGVFIEDCNATINRCNINNNTVGLLAGVCPNFTLEDCNVQNNSEVGLEVYFGNNTVINSNLFSRNGVDTASASGAFMVEDNNCTVTNNVFDSNYDSILMGIYDEEANNTQVYQGNTFRNNNFTFDFNYQLTNNYTNQQIYFYNNMVNDTAYVNPDSFTDDDQYVPSNAVFHLNTTLHLGTRPYSNGPVIGGNFWAHPNGTGFSQTGADANHDGFIDTSFELFGNASLGVAYDYHPYSLGFDVNTWVPITLPETITQPGNYKITTPWNGEGIGLAIAASNVVVDGQNNLLTLAGTEYDIGVEINNVTNVQLKNIKVTNGAVAVWAHDSSNFTIQDSTLSNSLFAGLYAYECSNFTVQNSVMEGSQDYSGVYVDYCSGFIVKGCSLNNNAIDGLTAQNVDDFTVIDSTLNNNDWGIEMWYASNGTIQNCLMSNNSQAVYSARLNNVNFTGNTFSFNGLTYGTYAGGVEASNSNCTIANNVFEGNYDALMWSIWSENVTATLTIHDNIFHNNKYTFFYYNELPNSYTGQKLFFYNNLVNDTAYVDPVCFNSTYSGANLPFNNLIFNLNTTLQSGARIYGIPSKIGGNFWAHPDGSGYSQTATDANHDGFIDTPFDLFANITIGAIYDYLPYSQNYATSFAYTAGAGQSLVANQTSTLITVRLQDAYGPITSGATVSLTSNSTTGKFYSDAAGINQITTVAIAAGSSTASFYFKDTAAGTPTLTASSNGVISAATQFTINTHAASVQYLTIGSSGSTFAAGNAVNFFTTAYDQYGNSWNVTATYLVNGNALAASTITPTIAGAYLVEATYNDMTATTTLTVTPATLDHFAVLVPNSATVGTQFDIMIYALDAYRNIVTSFTGTVALGVSQGTITPSTSGAFADGVWTGPVTLSDTGSVTLSASDSNGHTGKSVNLTVNSLNPTPTPTPTPSPTSTIQVTTTNGATVNFAISGTIASSQITGATLSTNQTASTTTLSFTVTGQICTTGFCNITIPKNQVPYGTTPTVYIDGQPAQNQSYSQDSQNYYVWFSTSFSTHQVDITFTGQTTTAPETPIVWYAIIIAIAAIAIAATLIISKRKHKPTTQ